MCPVTTGAVSGRSSRPTSTPAPAKSSRRELEGREQRLVDRAGRGHGRDPHEILEVLLHLGHQPPHAGCGVHFVFSSVSLDRTLAAVRVGAAAVPRR